MHAIDRSDGPRRRHVHGSTNALQQCLSHIGRGRNPTGAPVPSAAACCCSATGTLRSAQDPAPLEPVGTSPPMSTPAAVDTDDFSRIVHATDFSTASEAAFAHGLRVALAVRGHFYLVHAEHLDAGEDGDWAAFPGVRSTLVRWGLLPVDADPAAVADRLGLRITKADIPDARPTDGVLRVVDNNHCNFLVLATHARDGLARLLQGSIAETLARRARIPTLFLPVGTPAASSRAPPARRACAMSCSRSRPAPHRARPPRWPCAWPTRWAAAKPSCTRLHVGAAEEAPTLTVAAQHGPRLRPCSGRRRRRRHHRRAGGRVGRRPDRDGDARP